MEQTNWEQLYRELLPAVISMRSAQNLFFEAKKRHYEGKRELEAAKLEEGRVRVLLVKGRNLLKSIDEPNLFRK